MLHISLIVAFIYLFGFIYFIPALVTFVVLLDKVLGIFGYERIQYADTLIIFHNYIRENSNIGIYFFIDKITLKELQDKIYQRAITAIPNMRRVPVEFLGVHFWKDVGPEAGRKNVIADNKKLSNEEEVVAYMDELINQDLPRDKPLFEFRLVENYNDDLSVVFYRNHHSFCDGVGASSLFSTIDDDQFTSVHKKQIFKPSLIEIITLTFKTYFGWKDFCEYGGRKSTHPDVKKFTTPKKIDLEKTDHATSQIEVPMDIVRKRYRQVDGMTFNDLMLA